MGDISGIIEKLPYISSLGVDCIWLSPHYMSPQEDMGYDISDYEDIYPPYGTLDQCQELIDACHSHGMKIIFDLVINHTSVEHKWFQESRSSKTNSKRDWYFWKPPRGWKDGKPLAPNNWRAIFGGPAWVFDERTQEFYLRLFATGMPDLNWENEETRKAIYESSMHFWLRRGIDGFRIDVVNKYSKDISFPDAPVVDDSVYEQPCSKMNSNGPRMHEFLGEMNDVFSQYRSFDGGEIMTVGELPQTPEVDEVLRYVSAKRRELSMVFNFDTVMLGQIDRSDLQPISIPEFKKTMSMWQNFVNGTDAWTTAFLENHDQGRSISRFGNDSTEELRVRSGKALATILATMTGTLFLYQGQEIGMVNMPPGWGMEEYKDVWVMNKLEELKSQDASPEQMTKAIQSFQKTARDHARIPMQWNDSANAGFCSPDTEPWMKVHDNRSHVSVQAQEGDEDSLLDYWKQLIKQRMNKKDVFVYGVFELLESPPNVFAFSKTGDDGTKIITAVNMSDECMNWKAPDGHLLITNFLNSDSNPEVLGAWEARVYELASR